MPRWREFSRTSGVRIAIKLKPGCLLAVLERLQLVGQSPVALRLDQVNEMGVADLILEFTRVNDAAKTTLVDSVKDLVGVRSISICVLSDPVDMPHANNDAQL